jgi:alginate O-acetyltransferase complex protein AlgI
MDLSLILIFGAAALALGLLPKYRNWLLLLASILVVYILQPALPIRGLDYWLPTLTLALTTLVWAITRDKKEPLNRADLIAAGMVGGVALLAGLNRYLEPFCCLTPTRPPVAIQVLAGVFGLACLIYAALRWGANRRLILHSGVLVLVGLFVVLKFPTLTTNASAALRTMTEQQSALAEAVDIRWLGFSYVAFRLIHILRDRLAGRMGAVSLQEGLVYAIFFPAFTAGPIDRLPRFTQELRKPFRLGWAEVWSGGKRVVWGIFKKFALADTLALVALNDANANQTTHGGWLWVLVYLYALRLYFDFSGYTDIAIGLGNWMGFKLPENFERPYLKPNLTQFWNAWHMTLAQWFRAYFFNPVTRWMRTKTQPAPMWAIILVGQTGTMLLIGLWHGITWNFMIWGIWHGVGLFAHNRWNEWVQPRLATWESKRGMSKIMPAVGTVVTFHYVTLGWVWFALSSPAASLDVLVRLLGFQ